MQTNPLMLDVRMRRLRRTGWLREMVQETRLNVQDLILPLFVHEETGTVDAPGLKNVKRHSIDGLVETAKQARDIGIPAIAVFPVVPVEKKTEDGHEAYNADSLICRAIATVKKNVSDIGVIADVALDPYTPHGHDGIVLNGAVANDETVHVLCEQALTLADAGADIVAPSDMMDGRVIAIRQALDEARREDVAILSYAAKYASAFYGPFRTAVGSKNALKGADKKTYQMNPANAVEAVQEVLLDIEEGADMLMVKPGSMYLDIIAKVKDVSLIPVFSYHVSGEYAMLQAAAEQGLLDFDSALLEVLISLKRAGSKGILTYGALQAAALIQR